MGRSLCGYRLVSTQHRPCRKPRLQLRVECAPAFNYARSKHTLKIIPDLSIPTTDSAPTPHEKALFSSAEANLELDLRYVVESALAGVAEPEIELKQLDTRVFNSGLCRHILLEINDKFRFIL